MVRRSNVHLRSRLCALVLVVFGLTGFALAVEPDVPEVTQWLLKNDQLTDAPGLMLKLRIAEDPVSEYFQNACSLATLRLLENYQADTTPSQELIRAVVTDLNRIMCEDLLFDDKLFDDVALSTRTQNLLGNEHGAVDLPQLNRRLLEDAYSNEIAPGWILSCFMTDKDLLEPRVFALSLRIGKDPVSRYLRDCLRPTIRQQLMDYTGAAPPPPALLNALIASMNQVILSDALFDKDRFAEVSLTKKTKLLIDQKPEGDTRALMNRLLLEDAYPKAIRRHAPSPIEVQADSLEYEHEKNLTIATGHVLVRRGNESLRSDHAVVNMQSYDVLAEGNVTFERGSDIWVGNKLRYNFKSQKGDFGGFSAFLDPFYAKAESSYQVGADEYLLENAKLSTCEGDHPDAYFLAKKVWIRPGHHVRAQHVVLYIKGVPVMYSPYWNQNIGDRNFMSIVPGYSSRMYAFLLTAFNYRISRKVEAATHVDVRLRRGVGLGQDIMWSASGNATELSTERYTAQKDDNFWRYGRMLQDKQPKEEPEEETWAGDLITYYTYDTWPDEGESQAYKIDNDRYRLRLYHNQSFDEQNYLMSQINYLSDPKIIEQFFREEYKSSPEPDNYIVLGHRAEHYTVSLMVEKRLNDFYTTVDRLPELKLDFSRQKIRETPFYYQGDTAGAYLQKNFEANMTNTDNYAAGRFNTAHMLYYPTKQMGFLNVIPRAGWQGAYYSKTKEVYTNATTVTTFGTNNQPVATSTTNILTRDAEARFRSLPELGLETSFKAFKVWETYPGDIINNVRHIAEPYANYTLVPEPNVTPGALYQFDDIDTLGKAN
ncbi:MAG: LptA/OstA family protein, partial [Verrucomicrobiota bacterium]